MNRRQTLHVGLAFTATSVISFARAQAKVWRIGFLGVGNASAYAYRIDALKLGLRDYGYTEGRNINIEYRWADGNLDRLPRLAGELVQSGIDVLVTHAVAGGSAARQATSIIPIVLTDIGDVVASGLVTNIARPGGNITGSTFQAAELNAKRLELLKSALPGVTRVGMLLNPTSVTTATIFRESSVVARSMKVELQAFEVRQPSDFGPAFTAMTHAGVGAVLIQDNPLFTPNRKALAEYAEKHRLPSAGYTEFADAGGLIGYGVNFVEFYRRAAYFVDRVIKGTKPSELPMEQPNRFELVLNLQAARSLGITIPQSLLTRADRVLQ